MQFSFTLDGIPYPLSTVRSSFPVPQAKVPLLIEMGYSTNRELFLKDKLFVNRYQTTEVFILKLAIFFHLMNIELHLALFEKWYLLEPTMWETLSSSISVCLRNFPSRLIDTLAFNIQKYTSIRNNILDEATNLYQGFTEWKENLRVYLFMRKNAGSWHFKI